MSYQSILGVRVRTSPDGWYWDTVDGSGWRWTEDGLYTWGNLPGTKRGGWLKTGPETSTLHEAVAYSLGWTTSLACIANGKIGEVAPTLVRDALTAAADLSRRAEKNLRPDGPLPSPEDYARAADTMRNYAGNLDSIVAILLNGAVSCAVALGNARAECERLTRLSGADEPHQEPTPPAAA